jgi:hypothetical protein
MEWTETMSTNSPSLWPISESPAHIADTLLGSARTVAEHLRPLLQATAFWSAVAMPFLYVPLLVGGLTDGEAVTFIGLLFLNVVALVLGHGHRSGDVEDDADAAGQ